VSRECEARCFLQSAKPLVKPTEITLRRLAAQRWTRTIQRVPIAPVAVA
jgi:hypothetical protein